MRKSCTTLAALAAMLLTGSVARADIINFGYSASSGVNPVDNSNTLFNNNNSSKTSSVSFTPANGAASFDTTSGVASQFIIYNLTTQSTVKPGVGASYDSFTAVPFNLGVTVTDLPSSSQQTFNFSGTYTAQHVSSGTSYVDPKTQGIDWTTPIATTQTIGTNVYSMHIVHWTAAGAPGSAGAILAEITVQENTGVSSPPPSAPEPASLLLAGLALPALLVARRRRTAVVA
jgi:hypothetical protein